MLYSNQGVAISTFGVNIHLFQHICLITPFDV
jgi:hypothetical protein